jgi:nucleoside-diphosphate-sugar epimerase
MRPTWLPVVPLQGGRDVPLRERTRARVATRLMEAHADGAVRATIGRASNVYGPHARRSIVGQGLFPPALSGKPARVLGDPDASHTYTFVDDFAPGPVHARHPRRSARSGGMSRAPRR